MPSRDAGRSVLWFDVDSSSSAKSSSSPRWIQLRRLVGAPPGPCVFARRRSSLRRALVRLKGELKTSLLLSTQIVRVMRVHCSTAPGGIRALPDAQGRLCRAHSRVVCYGTYCAAAVWSEAADEITRTDFLRLCRPQPVSNVGPRVQMRILVRDPWLVHDPCRHKSKRPSSNGRLFGRSASARRRT